MSPFTLLGCQNFIKHVSRKFVTHTQIIHSMLNKTGVRCSKSTTEYLEMMLNSN